MSATHPATFHRFLQLPFELRLEIWNYSLCPRAITFEPASSGPKLRFKPTPSILHVCSESRAFGLKHYTRYESDPEHQSLTPSFYFDAAIDLLYIEPGNLHFIYAEDAECEVPSALKPILRHVLIPEELLEKREFGGIGANRELTLMDLGDTFTELKDVGKLPALESVNILCNDIADLRAWITCYQDDEAEDAYYQNWWLTTDICPYFERVELRCVLVEWRRDWRLEPVPDGPVVLEPVKIDASRSSAPLSSEEAGQNAATTTFNQLPAELRRMVWSYLVEPRAATFAHTNVTSTLDFNPVPTILHINRESRAYGLEHYVKLESDPKHQMQTPFFYFNPDLDYLLLKPGDVSFAFGEYVCLVPDSLEPILQHVLISEELLEQYPEAGSTRQEALEALGQALDSISIFQLEALKTVNILYNGQGHYHMRNCISLHATEQELVDRYHQVWGMTSEARLHFNYARLHFVSAVWGPEDYTEFLCEWFENSV